MDTRIHRIAVIEGDGIGREVIPAGRQVVLPCWDERFDAIAAQFADVTAERYHVDILAAHFVLRPDHFCVVVGSKLFGDILSDLGPAVAGGIGLAASANLDPTRRRPSLFEPVHGSAPDIAVQGIANPVAVIGSGAMMLEHLGERDAAAVIMAAIQFSLRVPAARTRDVGGTATTRDAVGAVVGALESPTLP
jgi:tartrate dehydrogenase/decarboxylase / D-malate dehydrogenase